MNKSIGTAVISPLLPIISNKHTPAFGVAHQRVGVNRQDSPGPALRVGLLLSLHVFAPLNRKEASGAGIESRRAEGSELVIRQFNNTGVVKPKLARDEACVEIRWGRTCKCSVRLRRPRFATFGRRWREEISDSSGSEDKLA